MSTGHILAQETESAGSIYQSRPNPEDGPTEVSVGSAIINIESVSGSEQSFTAKFALMFTWNDPRLVCKSGEKPDSFRKFDLNKVWHPGILILNKRNLTKQEEEVIWVDCEGNAQYSQIYYGDLLTLSDVRDFPLL